MTKEPNYNNKKTICTSHPYIKKYAIKSFFELGQKFMHSNIKTMHMILDLMYSGKRPQLRAVSENNTLIKMTMNQLTSFDKKNEKNVL
jgi:hypothetical protein